MTDGFFLTVAGAALAENIVLTKMLGLCPFIGLSQRLNIAAGVGAATTLVLTLACAGAWMLDAVLPAELKTLRPLLFIAVVACLVQAAEMLMRLSLPLMHRRLGIFLPLIATNCAVLGVMLLALRDDTAASFSTAVAFGLGGGGGFTLAVVCFALLRERIVDTQVPARLRGAPLAMISAGWMTLAMSVLGGVFR